MKRFLSKFLGFHSLIIGVLLVFLLLNLYSFFNPKLPKKINTLVIGDSHAMHGIDPNIISNFSANVSCSGEPLWASFWKLRQIFKHTEVDTVIISVGFHTFSTYMELKFNDEYWCNEMLKRYALLGGLELHEFEVNYTALFNVIFKSYILNPNVFLNYFRTEDKTAPWIDNFKGLNVVFDGDTTSINRTINRHYYFNGDQQKFSLKSKKYLSKISELCDDYNKILILAFTPVSYDYYVNVPKDIKQKTTSLLNNSNLNFKYFSLSPNTYADSLMYDPDHMNVIGSASYTQSLANWLKNN